MPDQFTITTSPNHLEVDFSDAVVEALAGLKTLAEQSGAPKSAPFEPEVEYFIELIDSLRTHLPPAMDTAGWPDALRSGDKLDDFILMTIKDLARDARSRGTNASAKQAVMRSGAA